MSVNDIQIYKIELMELKLKVPFIYKEDINIYYEEMTKILKKSLSLPRENFRHLTQDEFNLLKKTTSKRMQELIERSIRLYQDNVDYCKKTKKQVKTVFQPPDEKLVKINAVKLEMIKSSHSAVQQEFQTRLSIPIQIKQAFNMKVKKKNGETVSIDEFFQERARNFPSLKESYEKIKLSRKFLKRAILKVGEGHKNEISQSNF